MATNPYVNKVQYGGNTLIDISDTTATPDKVQTGFKFYDASGRPQYGTASQGQGIVVTDTTDTAGGTIRTITGQLIEPHSPLGRNATLVKTVNFADLKLSDTTFSPTATASAAIKTSASTGQTYAANLGLYNYIVRYYIKVVYAYTSAATMSAMIINAAQVFDYVIARGFSSYSYKKAGNYNYNTHFLSGNNMILEIYNNSGSRTYAGSSYGVYIYDSNTAAYSNRYNDAITLTLYSPRLYCSGNNTTYFSAANRAAIDTENTTIQWWLELYQIDKDTSYMMNRYKTAVDLSNSMLE